MATYIVTNTHRAEECEALNEESFASPAPAGLDGTALLCTCPSGIHAAWVPVEADSEGAALAMFPPLFRAGCTAHSGVVMTFGKEIPVA